MALARLQQVYIPYYVIVMSTIYTWGIREGWKVRAINVFYILWTKKSGRHYGIKH